MTKRKMLKQRPLAFESLETRTLLAIIMNGLDKGFVEVDWDTTVPAVTHEQPGGPRHLISVRLYPTVGGEGNAYTVTVSFAAPGEATFSPAFVTFAAGEVVYPNPSGWKNLWLEGLDDEPVIATRDDGNKAYSIGVKTTTTAPVGVTDPFIGIDGAAGSFTNLDNDLWAKPDEGYSVGELDASDPQDSGYLLNVGANDQDLGGDGSWYVDQASLNVGQGEVEVLSGGPVPYRNVRYRPANDWYGDFAIFYTTTNEWGEISGTRTDGTVVNVPDKPIAEGDSASTAEDTSVDIDPLGNDTDADNWPVSQPANFGLVVDSIGEVVGGAATVVAGIIQFVPALNWNSVQDGDATIKYKVRDAEGNVSVEFATITVEVTPVNDAPEAIDDAHNGVLSIGPPTFVAVLNNDLDVDMTMPDQLAVISVTQGTLGGVTFTSNGVTYQPNGLYYYPTTDTFTYTIEDLAGATDTATVTITYTGSPLTAAAGGPGVENVSHGPIDAESEGFALVTPDALRPIVRAARARFAAAGVSTSVIDAAQFQVADLDGLTLAVAIGNTVLIDRDAAGFGWFLDATPGNDREFRRQVAETELWATPRSRAFGRMDLLTAVMHEIGHRLDWDHAPDGSHSLMEETLSAGVRRLPEGPRGVGSGSALDAWLSAAETPRTRRAIDNLFSDSTEVEHLTATGDEW